MRIEKNLVSLTLCSLLFFFNTSLAFGVNFSDVGANHWECLATADTQEASMPQKLKAEECKTVTEHLQGTPYTGDVREVEITGSKATILAYNILTIKFEEDFNSKKAKTGEVIYLVFDKKLKTEEGTTIIPAGSKLIAEITKLKRGKPFHINGEVELVISSVVTPDGVVYPINGKIENKEIFDPEFSKCNLKRAGVVAGSVTAFGTVLGMLIGLGTDFGDGTALGAIIGSGVGAVLGLAAPGCSVNVPANQEIYIKLTHDMKVNLD